MLPSWLCVLMCGSLSPLWLLLLLWGCLLKRRAETTAHQEQPISSKRAAAALCAQSGAGRMQMGMVLTV